MIRNRGTPTLPDCKCGPQPTNSRSKSTRTGTEVWTDRSIHCEVPHPPVSTAGFGAGVTTHPGGANRVWRFPVFVPYFQSVMLT